jgi:hypothetical protein
MILRPGYYWVFYEGEWQPAYYSYGKWQVFMDVSCAPDRCPKCGRSTRWVYPNALEDIGEPLTPPQEK